MLDRTWNTEKIKRATGLQKGFMAQIVVVAKIAEIKYPRDQGYRLMWIFDHSSCHGAYAEDALNALKMNMKPGGKQPAM